MALFTSKLPLGECSASRSGRLHPRERAPLLNGDRSLCGAHSWSWTQCNCRSF